MDDGQEIEARLRALGRRPVDPAVAAGHARSMAGVAGRPARGPRFGWRAVAAAGFVGFLAGSTGLAAAGTLPAPAQDLAHEVLGSIGLNVPRSTEGCPEGRTYRNHGQYVSEVEAAGGDVEAASRSACGKPIPGARRGPHEPGTPRVDADGDPCTGPPPWAGAHLPPDQRDALREERRALCGDDDADDEAEDEATTTTTG